MATRSQHDSIAERPYRATPEREADPLEELIATVSDRIGFPTIDPCEVDGDYRREQKSATLEVWDSRLDEHRVTLESDSITSGWHVYHDTPDGKSERLTERPLSREVAFAIAERFAADLQNVRPSARSGRALE